MIPRTLLTAAALASTLAVAACGSDSKSGNEAATTQDATPATALAEIGEVGTALDSAVSAVKAGDAKKAEQVVSEAYLQHFEIVEGPLEKVDHDLKEKLEGAIREDLRAKITSGASAKEVESMVSTIKADLATAEQKLK